MEKSSIAMRRLYDRLSHFKDDDPKAPVKQTQQDKSDILSIYGDVSSDTDKEYARWLNMEFLESLGVDCSGLESAKTKYLRSRYEVFWVYLLFPTLLILASFIFVVWYAIEPAA